MSSDTDDSGSGSICYQSEASISNADVAGIAVAVASEFSPATSSPLLHPNLALVVSDIIANLCFRGFFRLPGCWLGYRKD